MIIIKLIAEAYERSKDCLYNKSQYFALMCFKDLLDKDALVAMTYFQLKHIQVIYCKEFSELPDKLRDLMKY